MEGEDTPSTRGAQEGEVEEDASEDGSGGCDATSGADVEIELCRYSPRAGGSWGVCGLPATRPQALHGPIRRAFSAPWLVVLPDEPSASEVRLAAYLATGHLVAVGTTTQVRRQAEAAEMRGTHRFVYLGVDAHSRFGRAATAAWPVGPSLSVGHCAFGGAGHAAAFIAPASSPAIAVTTLDLVVTATDEEALGRLVASSYATNQPHTRAPLSNMLPDFVVVGPDFAWKGHGGMLAAGFFDDEWSVAEGSAVLYC